jgi:insulysin
MKLIKKNKYDKRDFVGGKLNNGIKYVLIQDSILTKSFVSISVNVGSYNNPKNYDGMAHFLEHMLFMGSKKYPDENYFYTILNKYGGNSNAYTSDEHTVYYFNVYNNGLLEIIDIFSRFFIDPLFNNDSLNREINAVHSEYEKNINNDNYAIYQFIHYLIKNDLTINNFFCGNLNTLNKNDIRDVMIKFYNKYYVSNNISICIMSNLPINNMYDIINTTFNNIPNKIFNNNKFQKPLFDNINNTYHFKSITHIYKTIYIWEIPNSIDFINTNDFNIFGNILSNISNTSLYYYLKNIGYINNINYEINDIGIFILELNLTSTGFNKLYYIEYLLFFTIKQIINSNIKSFASYFKNISKINYKCLTKEDPADLCNILSVKHFIYKTQYLYKLLYIIRKLKDNIDYTNLFSKYIKSNNFIRILVSNDYLINKTFYKELFQYKNHSYCLLNNYKSIINKLFNNNFNINKKYIDFIKNYNKLKIFNFNINDKYLDINIKLEKKLNKYNIPVLVKNNIWYGGNSDFNEPIVYINLLLYNNKFYNSPLNYILTELSCIIINHMISSHLYNALDIGYSISFRPSFYNELINISISGPNDINKLKIIINDIILFLKNINYHFSKLTKLYIDNLLISFSQNYNNMLLNNPWELSSILLQPYIYPTTFNINILLETLKTINYNIIKKYINNLFNNAYIIKFIYGNVNYTNIHNIIDIMDNINKIIKPCEYKSYITNKIIDKTFIHPHNKEISSCITYYYYIDKFSPYIYCLIKIFINIFQQSFFDNLRTKQQLGYLVAMSYTNIKNNYYIIQKIQSSKDIDFVKSKILEFNNDLLKMISKTEFNNAKSILKNELLSPEDKLSDLYINYINEIINQYYFFNRKTIILNELDKISIDDIINFIKKYITNDNYNIIYVKNNN